MRDGTCAGAGTAAASADDENLIRSALAALLALEEDLEVVAQAASGAEALAMARAHTPDVAVLDLQTPDRDGISVAGEPATVLPGLRGRDRHRARPGRGTSSGR